MISDSQTRYGSGRTPRGARQGSTRACASYQRSNAAPSAGSNVVGAERARVIESGQRPALNSPSPRVEMVLAMAPRAISRSLYKLHRAGAGETRRKASPVGQSSAGWPDDRRRTASPRRHTRRSGSPGPTHRPAPGETGRAPCPTLTIRHRGRLRARCAAGDAADPVARINALSGLELHRRAWTIRQLTQRPMVLRPVPKRPASPARLRLRRRQHRRRGCRQGQADRRSCVARGHGALWAAAVAARKGPEVPTFA